MTHFQMNKSSLKEFSISFDEFLTFILEFSLSFQRPPLLMNIFVEFHSVSEGDISENHKIKPNLSQIAHSYVSRQGPKGFWINHFGLRVTAI